MSQGTFTSELIGKFQSWIVENCVKSVRIEDKYVFSQRKPRFYFLFFRFAFEARNGILFITAISHRIKYHINWYICISQYLRKSLHLFVFVNSGNKYLAHD